MGMSLGSWALWEDPSTGDFGNEGDAGAETNASRVAQYFALKLMKNSDKTKNPNQEGLGVLSSVELVVSSPRIFPTALPYPCGFVH